MGHLVERQADAASEHGPWTAPRTRPPTDAPALSPVVFARVTDGARADELRAIDVVAVNRQGRDRADRQRDEGMVAGQRHGVIETITEGARAVNSGRA
jgi:hypothetical protein